MRRLEIVIAGIGLAVLAFGIALLPLLTPAFTQALTARFSQLPPSQAAVHAETTRRFVTGDIDAREQLSRLMPPDAVSHLDDVRKVIVNSMLLTVLLGGLAVTWILIRYFGRDLQPVAAALKLGATLVGAFIVIAGIIGFSDFDALFARFHAIFFAPGTWVFPSDSLLIRLFPLPFWIWGGATWAILILAVAAAYGLAARRLGRSRT